MTTIVTTIVPIVFIINICLLFIIIYGKWWNVNSQIGKILDLLNKSILNDELGNHQTAHTEQKEEFEDMKDSLMNTSKHYLRLPFLPYETKGDKVKGYLIIGDLIIQWGLHYGFDEVEVMRWVGRGFRMRYLKQTRKVPNSDWIRFEIPFVNVFGIVGTYRGNSKDSRNVSFYSLDNEKVHCTRMHVHWLAFGSSTGINNTFDFSKIKSEKDKKDALYRGWNNEG
jgi:hypothetical protein